jgi:hypothetical protein
LIFFSTNVTLIAGATEKWVRPKRVRREMDRNGEPKKTKAENPKKEFKIEIVKIGNLEDSTGTWGAPSNYGKHVYDRDANSRSSNSNSTNSYF